MKEKNNIYPPTVEVGRMREEIWKSLDKQGVRRGDGVVCFFASEGFKRPEERENVDLTYITPEKLGFDKPSSLDLIWKEVEMKKMGLEECPMETAVSLLDELTSKTDQTREYYVVNKRQLPFETNGMRVPEFLKLVLRRGETVDVLGWSGKDLIPLNGILVFKQGVQRVDLTNL